MQVGEGRLPGRALGGGRAGVTGPSRGHRLGLALPHQPCENGASLVGCGESCGGGAAGLELRPKGRPAEWLCQKFRIEPQSW